MNIVLVYQHFIVQGHGSTKPYDLAKYLVDAGHEVTVICGRGYLSQGMDLQSRLVQHLNIDGINVVCLGIDYRQEMSFWQRIASFMIFTFIAILLTCIMPRYDVMVTSSTPLTVGLIGLVSRYIRRIPYIFEIRDFWPEVPHLLGFLKSKTLFHISTFFEEWFYCEANSVCAISNKMIQKLIDRGISPDKLHFLPTGVNLQTFDTPPNKDFRRQYGLEDKFIAIYAGTIGRVNGLDYVVEAAGHLTNSNNIQIVVIGGGSEKPRLVKNADRRGLGPHPLMFLPPVSRKDIPGILKACDIMLMVNVDKPGQEYLMTNKFFDYLAAGKPILVNVDAELTEWILDNKCGLLCSQTIPLDLANSMRQLHDNPELAKSMGQNALKLAKDHFDRSKIHKKWEKVIMHAASP